MMGGLAYMTGLPDRPLRAGSSVIDITGGMFGVIAILSALHRRRETGEGSHVTSASVRNNGVSGRATHGAASGQRRSTPTYVCKTVCVGGLRYF